MTKLENSNRKKTLYNTFYYSKGNTLTFFLIFFKKLQEM